jgi:hypothetical protein
VSGQASFIQQVTAALERCGIPYMLAGSVASSFHGEPRATRDVDIVIDCNAESLHAFVADVQSAGWYASGEAATTALRTRSTFNVVDTDSGWKADLIIRKSRPFSEEEFRRRQVVDLLGENAPAVPVATPEDTILAKLEWHRESGSTQQLRDAAGVAAVAGTSLDRDYLRRWADELGISDLLATAVPDAPE